MKAIKATAAVVGAALSGIYLLNLTAGFVEFSPDNAPLIGNLDEVVATIILFRCLAALGIDTQRWFGSRGPLSILRSPTDQSTTDPSRRP